MATITAIATCLCGFEKTIKSTDARKKAHDSLKAHRRVSSCGIDDGGVTFGPSKIRIDLFLANIRAEAQLYGATL